MQTFTTPIVIIGYKRTDNLKLLLKLVKSINPDILYLILDGPKNAADKEKTNAVMKLVNSAKWAKKVHINASKINLGLKNRVVSGLNWVFSKVDRAIILEDDLMPDISFFNYCEILLKKYHNNPKIISIAGYSKVGHILPNYSNDSYYFSKYVESWGWATWKRAWSIYDDDMVNWQSSRNGTWFNAIFQNKILANHWKRAFDMTLSGKVDSWAYRWTYTALKNNVYTIVPYQNLISYHGYEKEATHTKHTSKEPPLNTVHFPLKHANSVRINKYNDTQFEMTIIKNYIISYLLSVPRSIYRILFSQ